MNCLCGCGISVKNRYVLGHQRKGVPVSLETRKLMSESHIGITRSVIDYGKKPKMNKRFYNTKPERFLKSILSVNGIQHCSQKQVFGLPDIFIEPNICIFVDGCYWHGCNKCGFNNDISVKKSNRDILVNNTLKNQHYRIIRIWEHDIYTNPIKCLDVIRGEI